jgi:hypothetical protein
MAGRQSHRCDIVSGRGPARSPAVLLTAPIMRHDCRVPLLIPIGCAILIVGGLAVMPWARRFDRQRAAARAAAGKRPISRWWVVGIAALLFAVSAVLYFGRW